MALSTAKSMVLRQDTKKKIRERNEMIEALTPALKLIEKELEEDKPNLIMVTGYDSLGGAHLGHLRTLQANLMPFIKETDQEAEQQIIDRLEQQFKTLDEKYKKLEGRSKERQEVISLIKERTLLPTSMAEGETRGAACLSEEQTVPAALPQTGTQPKVPLYPRSTKSSEDGSINDDLLNQAHHMSYNIQEEMQLMKSCLEEVRAMRQKISGELEQASKHLEEHRLGPYMPGQMPQSRVDWMPRRLETPSAPMERGPAQQWPVFDKARDVYPPLRTTRPTMGTMRPPPYPQHASTNTKTCFRKHN